MATKPYDVRKSSSGKGRDEGSFVVGKGGGSREEVFRSIRTGHSVTRVMNGDVYREATGRADDKIREIIKHDRKR